MIAHNWMKEKEQYGQWIQGGEGKLHFWSHEDTVEATEKVKKDLVSKGYDFPGHIPIREVYDSTLKVLPQWHPTTKEIKEQMRLSG